jgi:hypothetical protein
MLLKKISLLTFSLLTVCFGITRAQVYLNPFSQYGLGEISPLAQTNQLGMGGVTFTQTDPNRYNFANPASYSNINYYSFEMGAYGTYYQNKSDDITFKNVDANIPYLSLALPVNWKKRWGFSMGVMPYSNTGYQLKTVLPDRTIYQTGSGGLTRFYLGSSIKVFKDFYLGADAAYLFGNLKSTQMQVFPDTGTFYSVQQNINNTVGGMIFDAGFTYDIHFTVPVKQDKPLSDSISELRTQETNRKNAIPKPVSPKEKLQRVMLKTELAYDNSRDSLKTVNIPEPERRTKMRQLRADYNAKKRTIRKSINADTINSFQMRNESYQKSVKELHEQYNQKIKSLKVRRKIEFDKELASCKVKTKRYRDSIKVLVNKDYLKKYAEAESKYKKDIRELKKQNKKILRSIPKNEEAKYNPAIIANDKKESAYKDSINIAKQPLNTYNTLKANSINICSNYIEQRHYTLQLGGTANIPNYVPNTRFIESYTFSNREPLSDSLAHFTIPNGTILNPLGLGGSIELRSELNWKIALTAEYRQWSKFRGIGDQNYTNDYLSYGIGAQWTPPKRATGNNAFTTGNYRIGFRYSQLPYTINNAPVNDARVTLGIGLPRPTLSKLANPEAENAPKNWSYIDLALNLGQTGNFSSNHLTQQYIMLSIGVHIFEVNWFIKRKLE